MRLMGYAAAATAGVLAPVALALPALAGTQSPLLAGVSNVAGSGSLGDGEDGNGNGYYDGNGDGHDDGNGNGYHDGNGDGHADGYYDGNGNGYHDGNGDGRDGYLTAWVSGSTSTGDVSILLKGEDFPDTEDVTLDSPGLVENCDSTNLEDINVETDRNGHFDVAATGTECDRGTYQVIVTSYDNDDVESYLVDVHVD